MNDDDIYRFNKHLIRADIAEAIAQEIEANCHKQVGSSVTCTYCYEGARIAREYGARK